LAQPIRGRWEGILRHVRSTGGTNDRTMRGVLDRRRRGSCQLKIIGSAGVHGLAMSRYQDRIGTHSPEAGGSPTFGGTGGSWPRYLGGTREGASFAFWLPEQHSTPYPRGPWFQLIRLGPALSRRSASLSTKPRLASDRANGTVSRRTSFTTSSQKGNWLRPYSRGQANRARGTKDQGKQMRYWP
jgi:hypothetical protein